MDALPESPPAIVRDAGDLFPGAGRPTVGAATGVPFLAIGEAGIGITDGITGTVVGGVTIATWSVGVRPRFRVATSERTALMLVMPILFYGPAHAPGPGTVGTSSWMLARSEVFFDGAIGNRWHLAGGMGVIGAGSTEAIGQLLQGKSFKMPAYNGDPTATRGFAGGLWNTVATRASYTLRNDTHLFAEASLVMSGVTPADNVGGPPIVVNIGMQHAF